MLRSCLLLLPLAGCVIRDASFTSPGDLAPIVSASELRLAKDGQTLLELSLAGTRPDNDVIVQISSSNEDVVSAMTPQLVFPRDQYTTPQSVRIEAHQTADFDFYTETIEIKSAVFVPQLVTVQIIDPDILDTEDIEACPGLPIRLELLGNPRGPLVVEGTADRMDATITPSTVMFESESETKNIAVSGPTGTTFSFRVPAAPEVVPLEVTMLAATDCP